MIFWKMKYVVNEEITFNDVEFLMHFRSKMDQLERSTDQSKEFPTNDKMIY